MPDEALPRAGSGMPFFRFAGLLFIAYPVIRVLSTPTEPVDAILVLAAAAIFAGLLGGLARRAAGHRWRSSPIAALADVALILIATGASLHDPSAGWIVLFYYASTAASLLQPDRRAIVLIVVAGILGGLSFQQSTGDAAGAFLQGVSISTIGLTVFSATALRRTNLQLHAARRELAAAAVAEERDRIARDLHDMLGHSLSLIAIKSELAGRLLPGDPERARAEIADIEQVARESLASVRETVRGYHQPTLDAELAGARRALEAAGIEPRIENRAGTLPAPEDAILAWAVREAVTNVVRHSAARHGSIRTERRGGSVELEVVDDGPGAGGPGAPARAANGDADGGSGLRGLHERLELVGGRLEAGPLPTGGYRLLARVPVSDGEGALG